MEQIYLNKDYFDNNEFIHTGFYIQHRTMHMHSHEFWEIAYVYEGEGLHHTADGKSRPIKEGDLILISPGISHCITSPDSKTSCWVRVINLLLTKEKMKEKLTQLFDIHELDEYTLRNQLAQDKPLCLQMETDSQSIHNLLWVIAHEYNHITHGSELIMESSILNLLLLILRQYEQTITADKVSTTKNETIDTLIRYMKSNFAGPLTLDHLAAYVHLSPEYLCRYFKKHTGKNLFTYLTDIRLDHAKYLLRTTHFSISDISMHCGFQSLSNFQKVFKRNVGMTAGEYRTTFTAGYPKSL